MNRFCQIFGQSVPADLSQKIVKVKFLKKTKYLSRLDIFFKSLHVPFVLDPKSLTVFFNCLFFFTAQADGLPEP